MYFVNTSGRSLSIYHQGQTFAVLAWEHVDLPEDLYDYIESTGILEVDYQRYLAEHELNLHQESPWPLPVQKPTESGSI